MNKELYQKINILEKEQYETNCLINSIKLFLEQNEKNFKEEKSKVAIEEIKKYLNEKEKLHEQQIKQCEEKKQEFISDCAHELVIKYNYFGENYYGCVICNKDFRKNIPQNYNYMVDITKDDVSNYLEHIVEVIANSDKDLIEELNTSLKDMQYERNIKVYRRTT